jgi:hypothetical protein
MALYGSRRWNLNLPLWSSTPSCRGKAAPTLVYVFCTGKLWGGQDHAFQFCGGLVNYEAHYDLSWFRHLLGGNSPTSNNLILKMNSCYKWVSRELEKFAW